MRKLYGDIFTGGELVLRNVAVNLVEGEEGITNWHGDILLDHEPSLQPEQDYRIALSDGRGGTIFITSTPREVGTGVFSMSFHGKGRLEQQGQLGAAAEQYGQTPGGGE